MLRMADTSLPYKKIVRSSSVKAVIETVTDVFEGAGNLECTWHKQRWTHFHQLSQISYLVHLVLLRGASPKYHR